MLPTMDGDVNFEMEEMQLIEDMHTGNNEAEQSHLSIMFDQVGATETGRSRRFQDVGGNTPMMRRTRQEKRMDILCSQEFETQNIASSSTMRASSSVAKRLQGVVGPGQETLESAGSNPDSVDKRAPKKSQTT